MNTTEKRNALIRHCAHNLCRCCRLSGEGIKCKNPSDFKSRLTDQEIDAAFELCFSKSQVAKQTDTPHIKDSGERREFASGAVRDMSAGKGRMDLLPWAAILEVSKHCENGAEKYGEHNVDKGLPTHSFCDSAARHLAKYLDGWDDEPHLLAAAWNLLWAIRPLCWSATMAPCTAQR